MTNTWLNLRKPLDPSVQDLLGDLDDLLRGLGIPYLMTGAMAREILLHHAHGCARGRRTTDVDFGVIVPTWKDYANLLDSLEASGHFQRDGKQLQRLLHENAKTGVITAVDLVPFGAIASLDGVLSWPPEGDVVMRVLGYEQALKTAIQVRLDEHHALPMVSAVGLAILKIVAWLDRGKQTGGKDAIDFIELLMNHHYTLSDEELWDDYPEAMAIYEQQQELAAAWILGQQLRDEADEPLFEVIQGIFQHDARTDFINQALKERGFGDVSQRAVDMERQFEAFEAGLNHQAHG